MGLHYTDQGMFKDYLIGGSIFLNSGESILYATLIASLDNW